MNIGRLEGMEMRMIDADRLLDALNSIISDYTSEGKYPENAY